MVKFFLRDDKNPPKSSFNDKNSIGNKGNKKPENKEKSKPKKVLDYRIVIWKKMFNLIKAEHSIMIQKIIRKIKETKEKLENLNELPESEDKKERVTTLNKEVEKLDKKYQSFKEQKKHELKVITLYIIVEIFKIENIDKILEKAKIPKDSFKITELKSTVENNDAKKLFVEKLSRLTVYQQELEKCAQLIDVVQEKKLERKTKLKERKTRKYEKEHGIKNSEEPEEENENELEKIQEEDSHEQSEEEEEKKPEKVVKHDKFGKKHENKKFDNKEKTQNKKFESFKSDRKDFKHSEKEQKFDRKEHFNKNKPIQKERTEFKKTGRNKVKFEKDQKKKQFKNNENNKAENGEKQERKKGNPKYDFSKEMAHPSWQAKQELKQEVFIKPFQGKKMLL